MAVTNTGIVERNITGVNESDLWLDSEATSSATNTGAVERSITGVHDANFVRPLGDEEVINGPFIVDGDWTLGTGWSIADGKAVYDGSGGTSQIRQFGVVEVGKQYRVTLDVLANEGSGVNTIFLGGLQVNTDHLNVGSHTFIGIAASNVSFNVYGRTGEVFEIDNVSVKEVLVNRESTATNTGAVERPITGVNESDLWLDSESTSVVSNTGIVERPILGVNESDEMFPDNTISNIVNIAGLISSLLADLEARAATFENKEATQEILINLQKC